MSNFKLQMIMQNRKAGFTLVEILVAVAIFSVLVLYIASFNRDLFTQSALMQKSLMAEQQSRSALKKFVSSLRSASQASDGSYPISLAEASAITYFSDIDNDNLRERIRYYTASSTLYRGVTKPTGSPLRYVDVNETVSSEVGSLASTTIPLFSYYDENYDGASTSMPLSLPVNIPSIRVVGINISIQVAKTGQTIVFSGQVEVRNLKDNL